MSLSSVLSLDEVVNVNDFQVLAKAKLPKALYEYLSSGTDDEQSLAENSAAFKHWYLRPRVMRPVGDITTSTTLLGQPMSFPVFCSPAGVHALCDEVEGECATARACGDLGIVFGLSQHATRSIEQVKTAAPNTNLWYQAYILKDRKLTQSLIERALRAGYQGIFLTVDSVRFGSREADIRNGFNALPPPHRLVNYDEDKKMSILDQTYNAKANKAWDQNSEKMFEQNLTWDDVRWLKQLLIHHSSINGSGNGSQEKHTPSVPLVVKGIMTAEDALLAVEAGADAVMVSNHGGRQLDGCLAAIDALPEVVRAVGSKVPVLLDGGVRRGTDILKALALGATAVGIGKPMFFALAVGGQKGVDIMLRILQQELEAAMALCGCQTVSNITPDLITRHPAEASLPRQGYLRAAL